MGHGTESRLEKTRMALVNENWTIVFQLYLTRTTAQGTGHIYKGMKLEEGHGRAQTQEGKGTCEDDFLGPFTSGSRTGLTQTKSAQKGQRLVSEHRWASR